MAFAQYKVGKTYYGFDPVTKALVAFPDEPTLKIYFPQGPDKNAPDLPLQANDGLLATANQNPGRTIDPGTLKPIETPAPSATTFDPTKWGLTQEVWDQLNPADKAFFESATKIIQPQYDSGQSNVSVNKDLLNKALIDAQSDPDLVARYGDAAKAGASDIAFNLGQINANYATQSTQQNLEMAKQKKDLEDQIAGAGQAYSGFRKQAENLLGAQQANIVQSSRSQLQQNLQNLGRNYEQTFGSAALAALPNPLAVGGETYNPLGGITGSEPISQRNAVEALGQQKFNNEALTK